jgi:hypothetical protein
MADEEGASRGAGADDVVSVVERVPLLKFLLSSAGVLGLLIGIGFVIDAAQHDLLGIRLAERHTPSEYALLGGSFFIDTFRVTWRHPVVSLVLIALIVGIAITVETIRRKIAARWPRAPWLTAFVIVILASSLKSLWLDLPYMRMSDLLQKPPICEGQRLQDKWDHDTWKRTVCSRSDTNFQMAMSSNGIACAPEFRWSAWRQSRHSLFVAPLYSRLSIGQDFTINVFTTFFLVYCALLLYTTRAEAAVSYLATNVLRLTLLALVLLNGLSLPFVYGKVIRETTFPAGRIMYASLNESLQEEPRNVSALLISAGDDFVTFYDSEEHQFFEIARDKIHWIAVSGSEDLVAQRMLHFMSSRPCH